MFTTLPEVKKSNDNLTQYRAKPQDKNSQDGGKTPFEGGKRALAALQSPSLETTVNNERNI